MRQRVMVGMAMLCTPKLIIADEATTALDATIQAQLLELLYSIVSRYNTALVMVTHNLGIVARYAHRINVMYAGRIIESGTVREIWERPLHPYTEGLLHCVPKLGERLVPIKGMPPSLINRPPTCPFLPRCRMRKESCFNEPCGRADPRGRPALHRLQRTIGGDGMTARSGVQTPRPVDKGNIVDVMNLKMYFPVRRGLLRRKVAEVKALDDVSFSIRPARRWVSWARAAAGRRRWGAASCGCTSRRRAFCCLKGRTYPRRTNRTCAGSGAGWRSYSRTHTARWTRA